MGSLQAVFDWLANAWKDVDLGDLPGWVAFLFSAIALFLHGRANRHQRISAEATVRSANAAEKAVAIQQLSLEAKAPQPDQPDVDWAVERPSKNRFVLRNTGRDIATGVTVEPDQFQGFGRQLPEGAAIRPGASVEFLVFSAWGHPVPNEVYVQWDGNEYDPKPVPIPPW